MMAKFHKEIPFLHKNDLLNVIVQVSEWSFDPTSLQMLLTMAMSSKTGHSKQSGRSGFDQFSADQNMHISTLKYNTRGVVDIKTSKPGHHQKGSHHWTDIIPILPKVNTFIRIPHYLQPIQFTP